MSFGNFLRKLSFETDKQPSDMDTDQPRDAGAINSILNAPGKLLSSVNIKTGHLVSDLNQKLDLSGKLDTLRQASVTKLEHVYETLSTKEPHSNEKEAASPTAKSADTSGMSFNTRTKTTAMPIQRRGSNTGPRPPRPPPPTSAALNRAMSLDEANLARNSTTHQRSAAVGKQLGKLEPSAELVEDRSEQDVVDRSREQSLLEMKTSGWSKGDEQESSASEYGDHGDNPVYKSDNESDRNTQYEDPEKKEFSGESAETQGENLMDLCIPAILSGRWTEVQRYENDLRNALGTPSGRIAFVNKVEQESIRTQGSLEPEVLPVFLEKVGWFLTECQEWEDFAPARKLLTTSLLFYISDPNNSGERTFLFAYIKTQPIWQTLRFWNACFFQSVQESKARQAEQQQQQRSMDEPEKIVYEQIESYLRTMNVFDLHSTIKHEFLRKQSILFNLTDDEVRGLRTLIGDDGR